MSHYPETSSGIWAFALENTDTEDLGAWNLDKWQRELGPLVEPLAEWSDEGDILWIVPHAELHVLPLHALKVSGCYLADRNPVVYSPSASAMSYCRAKKAGNGKEALVVGDSLPAPNNLKYAREEAASIASLSGAKPLRGEHATKRRLEDELQRLRGNLRLLHIACHGEFNRAKPLESRIRLASVADGSSGDGGADLSAAEVLGLEIGADLTVLSACASGISGRQGGDELIGLTRSFLYAGVPSVVVGLWYVADESTRLLMERFYGTLLNTDSHAKGKTVTKVEALQEAQRHVLQTEHYEHPYFWAPFVLVGDWR